jgi:hypothetical protein
MQTHGDGARRQPIGHLRKRPESGAMKKANDAFRRFGRVLA